MIYPYRKLLVVFELVPGALALSVIISSDTEVSSTSLAMKFQLCTNLTAGCGQAAFFAQGRVLIPQKR